jgi:hypothetical protein
VLPSDEIDASDDLDIVHEFSLRQLIEPAVAVPASVVPLASSRPQGRLPRGWSMKNRILGNSLLRPCRLSFSRWTRSAPHIADKLR